MSPSFPSPAAETTHSHVSLVIVANFLDTDVVLGIDERLSSGVGFCHGYNAGHVLEVILVLNFYLPLSESSQRAMSTKGTGICVRKCYLSAWTVEHNGN